MSQLKFKNKKSLGENVFDILNVIILVSFSLTILYPFWTQLVTSLSTPEEALKLKMRLWPDELSLESYKIVFSGRSLIKAYKWTILRCSIGAVFTLIVSGMMAYALSKKYLPLRKVWTAIVVFTMFFNGGLIPTYMVVKSLNLIDKFWVLIFPMLVVPFNMIIMRNYFMSIPDSLEESAKVDGGSDLRIFIQIILPISKPIIATIGLRTLVFHWNQWFDALIYINSSRILVLQTYLRKVLLENQISSGFGSEIAMAQAESSGERLFTPETLKAAILISSTLPILCGYPFVQKYFVKGMMVGSLKG